MAFSIFLQRSALVILSATSLLSCNGDGMAPPALSSRLQPEGRVADRELLGPVGARAAYAPATVSGNRATDAIDYLDTPNLAGVDNRADDDPLGVNDPRGVTTPAVPGEAMALADRQPSLREQAPQQPMPQAAEYAIPAEGVNIDADLGIGDENRTDFGEAKPPAAAAPVAAQIMVPQGPMAIAEGETSQPVVDGIGTDNPTALTPSRPQAANPPLPL